MQRINCVYTAKYIVPFVLCRFFSFFCFLFFRRHAIEILFLLKRFPERVIVRAERAARFSNTRDVRTRLSTPASVEVGSRVRAGGVISAGQREKKYRNCQLE